MQLRAKIHKLEIWSDESAEVAHEGRTEGEIYYVKIKVRLRHSGGHGQVEVRWEHSAVDVCSFWQPSIGRNRYLKPDWSPGIACNIAHSAPVGCFVSADGTNRQTFAVSDTVNQVILKAGINEERAALVGSFLLAERSGWQQDEYEVEWRLDLRPLPYHEVLQDVAKWWEEVGNCAMRPLPPAATAPVYSTWYSMHQELNTEAIEKQCGLAKSIGCEVLIVDDGWQTEDTQRGYAFCGDWEPALKKMGDMASHVARVHRLGLRYCLWYALPFIGRESRSWIQFSSMLLGQAEELGAGILDPRFPAVRSHLARICERAVLEWDVDGLKLDFLDAFCKGLAPQCIEGDGRDMASVPLAVDALLRQIAESLRVYKPEMLIEFRQPYVGPAMRAYGTMFRAVDCPYDAQQNRMHTLDLRMLSRDTPVHSDMLMWSGKESPDNAAFQLINVLFSIPQLSMKLDQLSSDHLEMLEFWLNFWRENKDVFIHGTLKPAHPELMYPWVISTTATVRCIVAYSDAVLPITDGSGAGRVLILINGTQRNALIVSADSRIEIGQMTVKDCRGKVVFEGSHRIFEGVQKVEIPPAGVLVADYVYINAN